MFRNKLTKKISAFLYDQPVRKNSPFIKIDAYCRFCGKKGRNYKFLIHKKPDDRFPITVNVILKGEHQHKKKDTKKKTTKRKKTTSDDSKRIAKKNCLKYINLEENVSIVKTESHAIGKCKELVISPPLIQFENNCPSDSITQLNTSGDINLNIIDLDIHLLNNSSNAIELHVKDLEADNSKENQQIEHEIDIENRCYIYVIDKPQENIKFKITEKMISELLKGHMIDSILIDSYISLLKPSNNILIIPSEICTKIFTDSNYTSLTKVNLKYFEKIVGIFWENKCHFVCIYIKYNKQMNTGTFSYIDPINLATDDDQIKNEKKYFTNWR